MSLCLTAKPLYARRKNFSRAKYRDLQASHRTTLCDHEQNAHAVKTGRTGKNRSKEQEGRNSDFVMPFAPANEGTAERRPCGSVGMRACFDTPAPGRLLGARAQFALSHFANMAIATGAQRESTKRCQE